MTTHTDAILEKLEQTIILHLSRLHNLPPYDAAYLELALRLGLPLAILDKELRGAAQSVGVTLL